MPSFVTSASKGAALAPWVAYVIDLAERSAFLNASTLAMSGFFEPARTERPRPERAMIVLESAASLPALIS